MGSLLNLTPPPAPYCSYGVNSGLFGGEYSPGCLVNIFQGWSDVEISSATFSRSTAIKDAGALPWTGKLTALKQFIRVKNTVSVIQGEKCHTTCQHGGAEALPCLL